VGLVARVADNTTTLRKALDDANFAGRPVREAGKVECILSLVFRGDTASAASRSRLESGPDSIMRRRHMPSILVVHNTDTLCHAR
jgi:hypothetical protein